MQNGWVQKKKKKKQKWLKGPQTEKGALHYFRNTYILMFIKHIRMLNLMATQKGVPTSIFITAPKQSQHCWSSPINHDNHESSSCSFLTNSQIFTPSMLLESLTPMIPLSHHQPPHPQSQQTTTARTEKTHKPPSRNACNMMSNHRQKRLNQILESPAHWDAHFPLLDTSTNSLTLGASFL